MICYKCGKKLKKEDNFCSGCGVAVNGASLQTCEECGTKYPKTYSDCPICDGTIDADTGLGTAAKFCITLAVTIIVIALGVIVALYIYKSANKKNENNSNASVNSVVSEVSTVSDASVNSDNSKASGSSSDVSGTSSASSDVSKSESTVSTASAVSAVDGVVSPDNMFDTAKKATVAADGGLRLREGPGTDYDEILFIGDGEGVEVYYYGDGWAYVKYGDSVGWVSSEYISE